jgi:hypothetical protein
MKNSAGSGGSIYDRHRNGQHGQPHQAGGPPAGRDLYSMTYTVNGVQLPKNMRETTAILPR